LSDFFAGLGVLVAAAGAAGAILLPTGRLRSLAMLTALVLFPLLILGDQWHSHQIVDLRHSTGRLVALGLVGLAVTAALAYAFSAGRCSCRSRLSRRCRFGCRSTPAATQQICSCRSIS